MPSGRAIVRHLATDKRFSGVGWATAERLWSAFGDSLYAAIRSRDLKSLAAVVGPGQAVAIVDGFGLLADEVEIYEWLDRYGVSPRVAGTAARLWGMDAVGRILADPYTLTLLEPWSETDARALRLGLKLDDTRRLVAAVDEALAVRFRGGHMASPSHVVRQLVRNLLSPWSGDPDEAVRTSLKAGRIVAVEREILQSLACRYMEDEVARLVGVRICKPAPTVDGRLVGNAIERVASQTGHRLSAAQVEAVHMATSCRACVISGGAGTGKTTVVRAILEAWEALREGLPAAQRDAQEHLQVALAGRAVRKIEEATGRNASTLSRLIHEIENAGRRVRGGILIFDESSMLDTPSIYRVLSQIPEETNLIFIGDPSQLPPIGAGLPFHAMVNSETIPSVTLDIVHRQSADTGIPAVAASVSSGKPPRLRVFDPNAPMSTGVFLLAASADDIAAKTLAAFRAMCGPAPANGKTDVLHDLDVQILTQTRSGPAGSRELNRAIEEEYMARQTKVEDWGLGIGSKVLWLRNDYSKAPRIDLEGKPVIDERTGEPIFSGFMNGSLGTLRKPHARGAWVTFDDGAADVVTAADLEKLTYGWAISVHKAQGSAFKRVIIPVTKSKLLDRTMLYTAVTRAIATAVLVGDAALIDDVISNAPRSLARETRLRFPTADDLEQH
jgi:exodeoxyribonuclease V alpha subunit